MSNLQLQERIAFGVVPLEDGRLVVEILLDAPEGEESDDADDVRVAAWCVLDTAVGAVQMLVGDNDDASSSDPFNDDDLITVAHAGRTIDGNDEAARSFFIAMSEAIAGSEIDYELVFGSDGDGDDDDGDGDGDVVEVLLSAWLQGLGGLPAAGLLARPEDAAARHEKAAARWQRLIEAMFVRT